MTWVTPDFLSGWLLGDLTDRPMTSDATDTVCARCTVHCDLQCFHDAAQWHKQGPNETGVSPCQPSRDPWTSQPASRLSRNCLHLTLLVSSAWGLQEVVSFASVSKGSRYPYSRWGNGNSFRFVWYESRSGHCLSSIGFFVPLLVIPDRCHESIQN